MIPATRRVVNRSPSHTVRLIHLSHLQSAPIEAESSLERDFVHVAALFPFTRAIQHQPFKLVWDDASYTPDFLLTFKDASRLVVEVKPLDKVPGYEELFGRAAEKLKSHKLPFLIAQDTQIRQQQRASNALEIRRYAKTSYSASVCNDAMLMVSSNPSGVKLPGAKDPCPFPRTVFLHLVSRRLLALSSSLDIGPKALVFPINEAEEESHAIQFASWFDAEIR